MLEPGTTVRSPRGTVVEVLEDRPERFAIRRTLPPGTGRTAPHRHFDGTERFTVVEGRAKGSVGRRSVELGPGDVLEVPLGAAHVHPHTDKHSTAVVEHVIEPAPEFVRVYFASWLPWLAVGRVDGQEEPKLLGIMSMLHEAGAQTWVAGVPVPAQRALGRALAPIAARTGLRARTPPPRVAQPS